jgi:Na+/melibiose symporter-like transporter
LLAFFLIAGLHRRFEKRHTIIGAASLTAFAAVTPISLRLLGLFPANGAPSLMKLLLSFYFVGYLGIALLTISVLSALADVADEHELTTGRRQEGIFFAARTLFNKISSGAGHIIAGLGIDFIHFPKAAKPGAVPDQTLFELGVLNGPLAVLPALLAIFFYAHYHIDRRRHAEIQAALAERRKAASAPNQREDGLVHVVDPVAGEPPFTRA